MPLPKTLVIGINTHGEIPVDENLDIYRHQPNINILKIDAVAPGVSNIYTLEHFEKISQQINNYINRTKNWNKLTNKQITKIAHNLTELLLTLNTEEIKNIVEEHQRLYSKHEPNIHFQRFSHSFEHSYKLNQYSHLEKHMIHNKIYSKFEKKDYNNPDNIDLYYFNKIIAYNLTGQPDIFDIIKSLGVNIEQITLFQLIDILINSGVKNIIIIDLSCSTFKSNHSDLSERYIRSTRRIMLQK